MFGGMIILPLVLQIAYGVTPTQSGLLMLPMLVLTCSWILVVHVQGAIAPADVAYKEAPTIFSRKCFEAHAIGEFLQHR